MKKILIVLSVALLAVSCKFVTYTGNSGNSKSVYCDGAVKTEVLEGLTGFDAILVKGHAEIEFTQADSHEVKVSANEDLFAYLDFKVEGGVLLIQFVDGRNYRPEKFEVAISAPVLKDLTINGAGDFDLKKGYRAAENLGITVNGAGDIEMTGVAVPELDVEVNGAGDLQVDDLDVESLSVAIHGAGDVTVSGKAEKANFSVSGAGDIDARKLKCEDISTRKSGIASVRLPK